MLRRRVVKKEKETETGEKEQDSVRLTVRCARCALAPPSSILIIRRSFLNDLRIPARRTTSSASTVCHTTSLLQWNYSEALCG